MRLQGNKEGNGVWQKLRIQGHRPPLPSILLANVRSLDIRDCNIFGLTETWLTPLVPDRVICPAESFYVFRVDRTEESGKSKGY